jgi:hypothetical protein
LLARTDILKIQSNRTEPNPNSLFESSTEPNRTRTDFLKIQSNRTELEPEKFGLFRSLIRGNDLPPRHSFNQIFFRIPFNWDEYRQIGHRSKLELLSYLDVQKFNWISFPWNPKERKPIALFGNENNSLFQYTAFVFRLYSCFNPKNERSSLARACIRHESVILFLESLDFKIKHRKLLPEPASIKLHLV